MPIEIRTAEQIRDKLRGCTPMTQQKILEKWGKDIINACAEALAPDDTDSEVVRELKNQL